MCAGRVRAGEREGRGGDSGDGGDGGNGGGSGGEVVGHGSPLAMFKLLRFPLILLLCVNVIWVAFIAGAIQPTFEPRLHTVRTSASRPDLTSSGYHSCRHRRLTTYKTGSARLK